VKEIGERLFSFKKGAYAFLKEVQGKKRNAAEGGEEKDG